MSIATPKKTCATPHPAPNPQTSRIMFGVTEWYTIDSCGMVTKATAKGRTTSAKTVQTSQIFSQVHFRAYFIGIVKLAFITLAMIRVTIPLEVLMVGFLPLNLWR